MREFQTRHALLLVIAVAAAVYANSLWNGFAYDDYWIVEKNSKVHQLTDLAQIWATPYWSKALGAYRPLTIFAFALQWKLGGGAAWAFHLSNALLHAGVSSLVFLLLARLVDRRGALFGALLFAVHPVHTEAVANVVGQAELLAAGAVLGACLIYATRERADAVRWPRVLAIAALYMIGLFAKESAIVLPGLLVILDLAEGRVNRQTRRGYIRMMAGLTGVLVAAGLCYFLARVEVLGTVTSVNSGPALPFLREEHRFLSAFRAWPEYLRLLVFPYDLSADYSPAVILPVESWTPMAVLGLVIAGLTLLAALVTPWRPAAGAGAAWFFVAIFPASNFPFPIGVLVAERTLYLPSVAASLAAAYAWAAVAPAIPFERRRLWLGFAGMLLVLFGARTAVRNPDWMSTDSIFESLLRDHPESYRAHWTAASRTLEEGDPAASRIHWETAYRIWPRDGQLLAEYGYAHLGWNRIDRAIQLLEESRTAGLPQPPAEFQLGMAYILARRHQDAVAVTKRLAPVSGPNRLLFDIRGRAYHGLGQFDRAAAAFRAAIRQPQGDTWGMWALLARALADGGRGVEAVEALATARLRAASDSVALHRIEEYWSATGVIGVPAESASRSQNASERIGTIP